MVSELFGTSNKTQSNQNSGGNFNTQQNKNAGGGFDFDFGNGPPVTGIKADQLKFSQNAQTGQMNIGIDLNQE